MQNARRHGLLRSDRLYAHGFRCYFTPLPGYFSPFPHGTSSLSVAKEYLALRGGPRGFRPGFPCPAVLRYLSSEATPSRVRDSYSLWCGFPSASATTRLCNSPTRRRPGLGSSLFARHYSGSRGFFPFLWVLRCFSSPACLYLPYVFRQEYARITTREFLHSDIPGSKVGQHLPRAYRSRPRPSSALGAKASTVCPCSLDSERTR